MKLAIVVQRYGADISGGAELHARYIAERLSSRSRRSRADHLRARPRDVAQRVPAWARRRPWDSGRALPCRAGAEAPLTSASGRGTSSAALHSIQDELEWLDSEGPVSPDLVSRLRRSTR